MPTLQGRPLQIHSDVEQTRELGGEHPVSLVQIAKDLPQRPLVAKPMKTDEQTVMGNLLVDLSHSDNKRVFW